VFALSSTNRLRRAGSQKLVRLSVCYRALIACSQNVLCDSDSYATELQDNFRDNSRLAGAGDRGPERVCPARRASRQQACGFPPGAAGQSLPQSAKTQSPPSRQPTVGPPAGGASAQSGAKAPSSAAIDAGHWIDTRAARQDEGDPTRPRR
jgi:hypothetical protein